MKLMSLISGTALLIAVAAVPVTAQQSTGYLKTKVSPGRAGVFVDGKYVGPAANFGFSRKYSVAPGEHEIRLSEPRYEDFVTKVTIRAGETSKISQTLKPVELVKPPYGKLRTISADKFAAVYVNDRYMGHVDEFSNSMQGLLLNPGTYAVKVAPVSGAAHEEKITIEANKTTIVRAGR
jgi:hypothetical protein